MPTANEWAKKARKAYSKGLISTSLNFYSKASALSPNNMAYKRDIARIRNEQAFVAGGQEYAQTTAQTAPVQRQYRLSEFKKMTGKQLQPYMGEILRNLNNPEYAALAKKYDTYQRKASMRQPKRQPVTFSTREDILKPLGRAAKTGYTKAKQITSRQVDRAIAALQGISPRRGVAKIKKKIY